MFRARASDVGLEREGKKRTERTTVEIINMAIQQNHGITRSEMSMNFSHFIVLDLSRTTMTHILRRRKQSVSDPALVKRLELELTRKMIAAKVPSVARICRRDREQKNQFQRPVQNGGEKRAGM